MNVFDPDSELVRPGHPLGGQEERSDSGLERRRQDRAGVLGASPPPRDALAAGHELLRHHRLRHHAGVRVWEENLLAFVAYTQ